MKIEEKAYAKINLGLKIKGKRKDGYHDIASVLQTIDLCDLLILEEIPSGEIEIVCSDPRLPTDSQNLVHKALSSLKDALKIRRGVSVRIQKNIPKAAGLGGGSSDAAAALRSANRLWDLGLDYGGLFRLASGVGSDVPFFLQPGTAITSGRGQILNYISWSDDVFYVLVYPGIQISTAWAYEEIDRKKIATESTLDLTKDTKYVSFLSSILANKYGTRSLYEHLENDFENVVYQTYPEIFKIKEELISCGALSASLSGSGSTVYGIFGSQDDAQRAEGRLKADTFWSKSCSVVQWQDYGLWSRLSRFESSPSSHIIK